MKTKERLVKSDFEKLKTSDLYFEKGEITWVVRKILQTYVVEKFKGSEIQLYKILNKQQVVDIIADLNS